MFLNTSNMWQTFFLYLALYAVVWSIMAYIARIIDVIINRGKKYNFTINIIMIAAGLTYILWYCN